MRPGCVLLLLFSLGSLGIAQAHPIDTANSTITVHAYKSGLFSFAGHDHIIRAPVLSGSLDPSERRIDFTIRTRDMEVLDPGESEKNKAEIRGTMLGDKLLDAEKYPEIRFRSTAIRQLTPTTFEVRGELVLHGVTRALDLKVVKDGSRYTGEAKLKQTDFGLTPVSAVGGTVKVKDEVAIEFSLKE